MLHHQNGRGSRIRTCDKRIKSPLLYQLSYTPKVVAADGFEPSTTALSALCSTPELCGYCTLSRIHFQYSSVVMAVSLLKWWKRWDSNPRTPRRADSFQDCSDKPDSGTLPYMEQRVGFEPTALRFCRPFPWASRAPLRINL